jgi:plasmid stabilization system protein ParE
MAARVREVVWAQSARDALDEVIEYIARDSRQAAVDVLEEALRAGVSLATLSERGRIVRELNDPTIRELLVFSIGCCTKWKTTGSESWHFSTARAISRRGGRLNRSSSKPCVL